MGAADDLRASLDEVQAIDHHAHLLAGAGASFGLTDLLTESSDPEQISSVRDHPSYRRAVADLAAFLDVDPDEDSIQAERSAQGFEAFTRRLMGACRLAAMLVDDGFRFPGALSLRDHAALVGCPVRRIVRIESEVERAAMGWPPFDLVRARFRQELEAAAGEGAAGLKTIAAYRCGLDLPVSDAEAAGQAYGAWRASETARLVDPILISFFIDEALSWNESALPLQIHTGFGDADLTLHLADPSLLQPLIERNPTTKIVLLHCYPFIRNASYLAHVYANVHLDLSLALTYASHSGPGLVLEALDLAPASKLLFATDASRLPELFLLGSNWWRAGLAEALGRLVDRGDIDGDTATRWGNLVLAGNARRLYGADGG